MARKLKSDKLLFLATFLLVCASVVMVYSASAVLAMEKNGNPYYYLFKQGAWTVLGLLILWVAMRIDYRNLRQPVVIWSALGMVALALVLVLFMPERNGSRRWFAVGGITLQPSELAKITIILFTAALLERRMHRVDDVAYSLMPIGLAAGLVSGLILLEPDFGTALSIIAIVCVMIFSAGLSYRYIVGAALVMLPVLSVVLLSAGYRRRRIFCFLNPEGDPLGCGYQFIQSKIAIGKGGIFGQGVMDGTQKLFYLPEPHTDFIFAVIGEELGLIGATLIVLCFCVIAWRGFRAAVLAPDRFGAFLAIGLTTMVVLQAFFNISVVLGLVPNKGIPLPFVSAGGSSLLINLMGMGILLNVSQHATSS
ncbi:MAG: putative lipid II flippase FtsW [Acidobacteriota bacterium]|nr:putative lipid II flippase FtsW [Acidobacteriota bacterium]